MHPVGGPSTPFFGDACTLATQANVRHRGGMSRPTIVVIDDNEPFRRALRAVAIAAGCIVVGEAHGPAQARSLLDELDRPDLVIVDVNLDASSGIDLVRQLTSADPALRIVLVSTMDERDLPSHSRQVGAIGFVAKSQLGPELVHRLARARMPEDRLTEERWRSEF